MKIILELPDLDNDLDPVPTEHDLRIMMMDAFSEYGVNRGGGNARKYVERRYIEMPSQWREEKIKSVQRRIRLSERLHSATFNLTIE